MTTNQIRYQEHLETKRHNVATETETSRSNQEKEKIQRDYNVWFSGETTRHNQAQEALAKQTLIVNDAHYQRQDFESQRHNLATEQLQSQQLSESQRHNKATEDEARRHNTVSEAQTWQELAIDKVAAAARETQAQAAMQQAQAALSKATTEGELADHKRRLETAEFYRESQWKEREFAIDSQKADASLIQAHASDTQASVAQWNSLTQSSLADSQQSQLKAQTELLKEQAELVPYQKKELKSQTSLNNARASQTDVNTKLGILDRVVDVARSVVKKFGGNER